MTTAIVTCPHCATARAAADVIELAPDKRNPAHFCVFSRCRVCDDFLLLDVYRRSGAPEASAVASMDGDLEQLGYAIRSVMPQHTERIPDYLPEEILSEYDSALKAYQQRSWTLAAIGFRRVLDISTRKLWPDMAEMTLTERLEKTLAGGHVTSPLLEWLRQGDWPRRPPDSEVEQYTEADAIHLRYFCEGYLKYVYELPGLISDRRERAASEITDPS